MKLNRLILIKEEKKVISMVIVNLQTRRQIMLSCYITLQNKFVIRQIQKCPTAKYIVHLKCTVK